MLKRVTFFVGRGLDFDLLVGVASSSSSVLDSSVSLSSLDDSSSLSVSLSSWGGGVM